MKPLVTLILFFGLSGLVVAQQQFTKTGHIRFHSEAPLEVIEADNYQVSSILNTANGELVFKVAMKSFQFKKALMQEHFNEKYVESDKYPESVFSGKITNFSEVDFSKDGVYNAVVEGNLTIHNVTKPVQAKGTITVKGGKVAASSVFQVALADHDITIPSAVKDNIAKTVDVYVDMNYEPRPTK